MNAQEKISEVRYGSNSLVFTLEQLQSIKALKTESNGQMWPVVRGLAIGYVDGVKPESVDELCAWVSISDHVDKRIQDLQLSPVHVGKMDYVIHLQPV